MHPCAHVHPQRLLWADAGPTQSCNLMNQCESSHCFCRRSYDQPKNYGPPDAKPIKPKPHKVTFSPTAHFASMLEPQRAFLCLCQLINFHLRLHLCLYSFFQQQLQCQGARGAQLGFLPFCQLLYVFKIHSWVNRNQPVTLLGQVRAMPASEAQKG